MVLNLFAGKYRLNLPEGWKEIRNDLNPDMDADYHMDALEFVKSWEGRKFNTVILDPPYSYRKSMTKYGGVLSSPFNQIKNEVLNIMETTSIVMTMGYHSNVMGKKRKFNQEHILLMSHGGAIHDTILSLERWNNGLSRYEIDVFFSRKPESDCCQ